MYKRRDLVKIAWHIGAKIRVEPALCNNYSYVLYHLGLQLI